LELAAFPVASLAAHHADQSLGPVARPSLLVWLTHTHTLQTTPYKIKKIK
jgi:hypothetical protein